MALPLSLNSLVPSIMIFLSLVERAFSQGYYDDVPNGDAVGFVIVFTIAFVTMIFSLVGIIYVFARIYIKWKDTKRSLSIALRVPLYLGVLNAILWVGELVNFVYPAIYHTPWPGAPCKIMAGISVAFTLLERFMTAAIAITTYLKVCRKIRWNHGKYDWKLWFVSAAISLLFTIMGSSKFGNSVYWCGAVRGDPYVLIVGLGVSTLVLVIVVYCYVQTILEVRAAVRQASAVNAVPQSGSNSNSNDHLNSRGVRGRRSTVARPAPDNSVEARVTRKVMGYILVFILQWVPIYPYDVNEILDRDEAWAYALVAVSFNFGGIGNAICYIINEGWNPHGSNSTLNESTTGDSTSLSSNAKNMGRGSFHENDDDDLTNAIPMQEHSTILELSQVVMVDVQGGDPVGV